MPLHVLLTNEDRERYGLPADPLELDLAVLMQDEAELLDDQGVPVDGKAWTDWLNSGGVKVRRVVVWLAMRRHGVDVALGDVKFNRRGLLLFKYAEGEGEPGKGGASGSSESPGPDDSSPDSPV